MFITKFPDVIEKLSYILVIGISKWCFVIPQFLILNQPSW